MTQLICLTYLRSFKHLPFKPSYVLSKKPDDNSSATRNFSVSSELRAQYWGTPTPPPPCLISPFANPCGPPPVWPLVVGGLIAGAGLVTLMDKYCEYCKRKKRELQAKIRANKYCRQRYFGLLGLLFLLFLISLNCLFGDAKIEFTSPFKDTSAPKKK